MRGLDLARFFVLEQIYVRRARHPGEPRASSTALRAIAVGLRSINGDALILSEGVEHAYRIRAAADASDDRIR